MIHILLLFEFRGQCRGHAKNSKVETKCPSKLGASWEYADFDEFGISWHKAGTGLTIDCITQEGVSSRGNHFGTIPLINVRFLY